MALGAARGLLGAALVTIAVVLLVWPLWYLATAHTGLYTTLVLTGAAVLAVLAIVTRLRGSSAKNPRGRPGP